MEKNIIKNVLENYPDLLNSDSFNDAHLGGCNVKGDPGTECPKMWKYICQKYNINSVIDIGCGFGFHLKYFKDFLNLEITGIEGSEKVQRLSFFPEKITAHDYTKGESPLKGEFDLCWSIEFVEHVNHEYRRNFLNDFSKCKYIIMTHGQPGQGGHNHVNCQDVNYWINELKNYNIHLNQEETSKIRDLAMEDYNDFRDWQKLNPENRRVRGVACQYNSEITYLEPLVAKNGLFFQNKNFKIEQ
jgi:SAM-dependent methyltransferase